MQIVEGKYGRCAHRQQPQNRSHAALAAPPPYRRLDRGRKKRPGQRREKSAQFGAILRRQGVQLRLGQRAHRVIECLEDHRVGNLPLEFGRSPDQHLMATFARDLAGSLQQPGLADSGLAHQRHRGGSTALGDRHRVGERAHLRNTPHQWPMVST
jgi:hypothetical protein